MVLGCFVGSFLVRFGAFVFFLEKHLDAMQVDFPVRVQHPRASEINKTYVYLYNILNIQ